MSNQYEVFFLGAGKPASGATPSALKVISADTRALDWQINSVSELDCRIHFLGGYHAEEVIQRYPNLHYTIVAGWEQKSVVHTLLEAPFSPEKDSLLLYSDTIFRPKVVERLTQCIADVVLVFDSKWKHRYADRDQSDIDTAEIVGIRQGQIDMDVAREDRVEFTGFLKLTPEAVGFLRSTDKSEFGTSLISLLERLSRSHLDVKAVDAQGDWAEFNSPSDIANFVLGTKAETLARLAPLVRHSIVGEQVSFTVAEWQTDPEAILNKLHNHFPATNLVVRSSAKREDGWEASGAGSHESVLGVPSNSLSDMKSAVNHVIDSYQDAGVLENQVLVQEQLNDVASSGVVFTRALETGAPYYRFNFDDRSASTESVTNGRGKSLRTIILCRPERKLISRVEPALVDLTKAIVELEELLGYDRLDIEFAIDQDGNVHIFQVRPITVDHSAYEIEDSAVFESLAQDRQRFRDLQSGSPFVVGRKTLFGVMPDWNPAEIIGTRPSPLAFSLYRELITNDVWAQQRAEYGYRDIRPHSLIITFSGQPYVDVRASLNSFVPAQVPETSAERIVEAYLRILGDNPQFHDKIEFEVAFTIFTPSFYETAERRLLPYGVTPDDIDALGNSLLNLTRNALTRLSGDTAPIAKLAQRRNVINSSALGSIEKCIALLEDCRRFGTLAFSHAARAGFVATAFLNDFVALDILKESEKQLFLKSINTVTGEFEKDSAKLAIGQLTQSQFIDKYGHLRPGTYDVTVPAYWETPDVYLQANHQVESRSESSAVVFSVSADTERKIEEALKKMDLGVSAGSVLGFMGEAIRAREQVKFEFTHNLSCALDNLVVFGRKHDIDREILSSLTYAEIRDLYAGSLQIEDLASLARNRQAAITVTKMVELPQLIVGEEDFFVFERALSQPNFVTTKSVESLLVCWRPGLNIDLANKIVMIPQADPGYDWIFSHGISGLVTQYGGANSHMAIRAAELDLPAAIGVGDQIYEELRTCNVVKLDCNHRRIYPLR